MMAEYIEREAAIESLHVALDSAINALRNAPSVDVAPVMHGHFVHDGPRFAHGVDWWHCSNCGRLASGVETRFDYCPWCGARMDGDSDGKPEE